MKPPQPIIPIALALSVCALTPVNAQDDGLPGFRPQGHGRKVLKAAGLTDEAPLEVGSLRRRTARSLRSVERPVRRRKVKLGLRGLLAGERKGGVLLQPLTRHPTAKDGSVDEVRLDGPVFGKRALYDPHVVSPYDVHQGDAGDCYLLAALAAVAHVNPGAIEGMITTNDDGSYTVRLFELPLESWWLYPHGFGLDLPGSVSSFTDVRVEPTFPVDAKGDPANAKGRKTEDGERELWVMLVEKAYAKLKGGYAIIGEGGYPGFALNAITGSGSEVHKGLPHDLDGQLRSALNAKKPIVLGSRSSWPGNGIAPSHAYAVIGTQDEGFVIFDPQRPQGVDVLTAGQIRASFITLSVGG